MITTDHIYSLFKSGQPVLIKKESGFWRIHKSIDKETVFFIHKNVHGTIVLFAIGAPETHYWVSVTSVLPIGIPPDAFNSYEHMLAFIRLLLRGSYYVDTVDNDAYLAGLNEPDFDEEAAVDDDDDNYDPDGPI